MPDKRITIFSGDTTTQRLVMTDDGHTRVDKAQKITWEITDDATNVADIVKIYKKSGDEIFSERPTKENNRKWKAKIKDDPGECGIYVYAITWKDDKGDTYIYDPIISINPSKRSGILKTILMLLGAVIAIFTVKFLQRNQSSR
jgi:hypothetical protein